MASHPEIATIRGLVWWAVDQVARGTITVARGRAIIDGCQWLLQLDASTESSHQVKGDDEIGPDDIDEEYERRVCQRQKRESA